MNHRPCRLLLCPLPRPYATVGQRRSASDERRHLGRLRSSSTTLASGSFPLVSQRQRDQRSPLRTSPVPESPGRETPL
ncbi:uncharacterized protein M6B38_152875 [Iris pallida]|uniref:Uncharacterized protein n=1 Tax=Iris pallida TaxID=29817 RepID=A0AAX6F619_IRIPA|nr:uncharacterized protein M6B38_152875 [Iris pallida]